MMPTLRTLQIGLVGLAVSLLPTIVDTRLWPLWVLFVFWLLLGCGIDALLLPRPRQLRLTTEAPEHLYVGDDGEATIELSGLGGWTRSVEGLLFTGPEIAVGGPATARVEAGAARLNFALAARRRGEVPLRRAALRCDGRLGLMRRQWEVVPDVAVRVIPDIRPVRAAAIRFASREETRSGMKVERFRGDGSELDSLREFVEGDDSRRIDWKHSARHRRLLTRQYRAERNHQIVLAIDTGHLMSEAIEGAPKLDHAISAALLLGYVGLKTGDRVGLFSFDSRPGSFLAPRPGLRAHHRLALAAAGLRYCEDETNFTLGLTTLMQRLRRRALVIVLTDFVDTITAELMVENVSRLARRHLVLFVALADTRLASVAANDPRSPLALNRAVVASRLQREREVVLRRLRDLGVLCVDARPRDISARMIDEYVDLKRRERI